LEKYGEGRLHPLPGTPESAVYLQWFHFGEATHQPYLSTIAQHTALLPEEERVPALAERAAEGAIDCNRMLDAHLGKHEYVAGDQFTAADIMVTYPLILSHLFRILPADNVPNLMKYYERISARPAFQTATAD
jgi:glutathione S-transferase